VSEAEGSADEGSADESVDDVIVDDASGVDEGAADDGAEPGVDEPRKASDRNDEATPSAVLLFASFALLGVGLATLVGRYLFLPLMFPNPWRSILTGGAIGACVGAFSMLNGARRKGVALPMAPGGAALLVAAAVTLGVFFVLAPGDAAVASDLDERKLAGYRIALPRWKAGESGDTGVNGWLELEAPGERGRFMKLQWSAGEKVTLDEMRRMYLASAEARELGADPVTVDGSATTTLRFEIEGGKKVAVTAWSCPKTLANGILTTFVSLEWPELLKLHGRVLASVRCHEQLLLGVTPKPEFPTLSVPEGYRQIRGDQAMEWHGPQGDAFVASALTSQKQMLAMLRDKPKLRAELARTTLRLERVTLDGAAGGDSWLGSGREQKDGPELRVMLRAGQCGARSYMVLYRGPKTLAEAPLKRVLDAVKCP
jgi:hypothetical protein